MVGVKRGCHSKVHYPLIMLLTLYFLFRVGIVVDVMRRGYS